MYFLDFLVIISLLETISLFTTSYLLLNQEIKILLNIAKKGYKVNKNKESEFNAICKEKEENLYNQTKLIKRILRWIPIVNIITVMNDINHTQEELLTEAISQDLLVEITANERKEYDNINKELDKYLWLLSQKEKERSIIDKIESQNEIVPTEMKHKYTLTNPKIEGEFSVEEVQMLADVSNYGYRLGLVDGNPLAIIGVYSADMNFDEIIRKDEDKEDNYHIFKLISKKEAQEHNLLFTVYSYMDMDETKLQECLDNIMLVREFRNNTLKYELDTISQNTNNKVKKKVKQSNGIFHNN